MGVNPVPGDSNACAREFQIRVIQGVDDGFSVLEQVQDLGVVLFVFCFERRSYGSRGPPKLN